jgi:hypothetical protein
MRRILTIAAASAIATSVALAVGVPSAPAQEVATHGYTVQLIDSGVDEQAKAEGGELVLDPAAVVDPLQGDATCRLARIEFATGTVTPLPAAASPEACAGDLAFAPDGTLYGLLQGIDGQNGIAELVRFDVATGAATVVDQIGTFFALGGQSIVPFGGITFDGAGQLLVMLLAVDVDGYDAACRSADAVPSSCLYRIDDPSQPEFTTFLGEVARIPSGEPGALGSTLTATCDAVYSTPAATEPTEGANIIIRSLLSTVSPSDGARTDIGEYEDDADSWGADFDRAGTLWGLALQGISTMDPVLSVATLDPNGGPDVATPGAQISVDLETFVQGLAVAPLDCSQPEPAPIVLEPTFTG